MKAGLGKLLVRVALWLVEHPDTIKTFVDVIHQAKPPQSVPAGAA